MWLVAGAAVHAAPLINAQFTLTTPSGEQVTQYTYRGRWMLVYFGYSSCPDICPTVLLRVGGALDILGSLSARIAPIFITVDPQRDTSEQLSRYLSNFSPMIVGLRGDEAQLRAAARSFHAYYKVRPLGNDEYSIDHSSLLYLLKPDGTLAELIPDVLLSDQLAAKLKGFLKDNVAVTAQ